MVAFYRMRLAAVELGRRLAERGVLADGSDIFFLDRVEVESVVRGGLPDDLAERIRARRARHARHKAEKAPDFVRSDGVPVPDDRRDAALPADGSLRGL